MSAAGYIPRNGTLADTLIKFLKEAEPGTKLPIAQIAAQFGVQEKGVITMLRPAAVAGLLDFTQVLVDGKAARAYCLPGTEEEIAEADEEPASLEISNDSTGDLWFSGARVTTDGDVLLSSRQLQQLVEFATIPPVQRMRAQAAGAEELS